MDTTINKVTAKIKNALNRKNFVLTVFLDISGAFRNASSTAMINALIRKGVDRQIVDWITKLLTKRTATASLSGTNICRMINRGTPEGGILSPAIWNITGSETLDRFDGNSPVDGTGYADDFLLLTIGQDLQRMQIDMQIAINMICRWARDNKLTFSAEKTKCMIFTRKHRYEKPRLHIEGQPLEYVESFRYLGVILDRKLNWTEHVETQCEKAKKNLMVCRRLVGKSWGLSPRTNAWVYTAIVRPLITYGSIAWVSCLRSNKVRKLLCKVQRLACVMITSAMRSTPTAGMEILLGFPPLETFTKSMAIATCTRLIRTGHWGRRDINYGGDSHITILNNILEEYPDLTLPQDKMQTIDRTAVLYKTQVENRASLERHIRPMPLDEDTINCFTDGSKNEIGSGTAYIIKGHNIRNQEYTHLGQYTTVFQAEIYAINRASLTLLDFGIYNKKINFYIDSQGAIAALGKTQSTDKSVLECKRLLNKLVTQENEVTLNWIPGHTGQRGNEIADALAKRGASNIDEGLEPRTPISQCVLQNTIEEWRNLEHKKAWEARNDCRQTKLILPSPEHKWKKQVLNLERNQLRIITQLTTGHANLQRHRHIMGLEEDPFCDKCGMEQTAIHILTECPGFWQERMTHLRAPALKPDEIREIPPLKIVKFASATKLWPSIAD